MKGLRLVRTYSRGASIARSRAFSAQARYERVDGAHDNFFVETMQVDIGIASHVK